MIDDQIPAGVPTTVLRAGAPLEPPGRPVGHGSAVVVDEARGGRSLAVEWWYPAGPGATDPSVYELLPGIGFTAAATDGAAAAPGRPPLLVWSHGRVGTRSSYVMLCEGLARAATWCSRRITRATR